MSPSSFCFVMSFLIYGSAAQEFNITPIKTSSGLYYEKIGDVLLSNNNWEFVTSVDYAGYLLFYQYLKTQAEKLHGFCQEYNSKECEDRFALIRIGLNRIYETDENLANFLGIKTESRRVKRFWSEIGNFLKGVGLAVLDGVRTIYGGGGGQIDLSAYDRQIGSLQSGQKELENIINQQTTLFLVDSEKKASQIQWLEKTQGELQDKIGSLESDFHKDSEDKQKQLNELKGMLNETNTRLANQEKVQKKLVSDVKEIKSKLLKIDEDINGISVKVAENKKLIDRLGLKVELNSLSIDFSFLMDQFETEQKKLFDVIKNANKGDLDPYVLTPLNLIRMLQDIQPSLTEGHQFPFYPNLENAARLYRIIKPQVYLYNNKIIFIMKIPLVDSRFNIHKMTSLPISVAPEKFAFILPQEPFLLVDNKNQEFFLMSNEEFKDFCEETTKNRYFCRQIQHTSNVHSSNVCEINLFLTAVKIPKYCDKRGLVMKKLMFLQLQQPRLWIYVAPQKETLIITCGSRRFTVALEGTGFVSLADDCIAGTSEFKLNSIAEFTKPVHSNFSAAVDLLSAIDLSNIDSWEVARKTPKHIVLPFDFSHLDKISFPLIDPKSNLNWLYYTLAVVMILAAGAIAYYLYRSKKSLIDFYIGRVMEVIWGIDEQQTPADHSPASGDVGDDRLKLKVKLNRRDEKITKVSVQENQSSNDPEAEYLTVRFKVEKNNPGSSRAVLDRMPSNKDEDDQLYGNCQPRPVVNDLYLKQLRKIKPTRF